MQSDTNNLSIPVKATTKKDLLAKIKEVVQNDEVALFPLEYYSKMKKLNDASGEALNLLKNTVIQAINSKSLDDVEGFQVSKESKVNWSYDHDDNWKFIKSRIEMYQEKLKSYESLMKKAADMYPVELHDDGVIIQPAKRKSTTVYIKTKY